MLKQYILLFFILPSTSFFIHTMEKDYRFKVMQEELNELPNSFFLFSTENKHLDQTDLSYFLADIIQTTKAFFSDENNFPQIDIFIVNDNQLISHLDLSDNKNLTINIGKNILIKLLTHENQVDAFITTIMHLIIKNDVHNEPIKQKILLTLLPTSLVGSLYLGSLEDFSLTTTICSFTLFNLLGLCLVHFLKGNQSDQIKRITTEKFVSFSDISISYQIWEDVMEILYGSENPYTE